MTQVDIRFADTHYPILIGENVVEEQMTRLLALCESRAAVVVSDENVWRLHGAKLEGLFRRHAVRVTPVVVPAGERSKSLAALHTLYHRFLSASLRRRDPVIAFGGGVVGDLAGFAAATYMRGIPLVQMPTTLLAQVDSSVGGKVAVNLDEGKNLIGAFYHPSLVLSDLSLLRTLPPREYSAGMAEVIKYGLIGDETVLNLLAQSRGGGLEQIVSLCCECKRSFVEEDPYDQGARMMLNFGHTFGHAIEKAGRYRACLHGEAVVMGMTLAIRAGERLRITEPEVGPLLRELCLKFELPTDFTGDLEQLTEDMRSDKKNAGDQITLVLLRRIGEPFLYKTTARELKDIVI